MYTILIIENVDNNNQVHYKYDASNKRKAIGFIAQILTVPQKMVALNTRDRTEILGDEHNLWNNHYRVYVDYDPL